MDAAGVMLVGGNCINGPHRMCLPANKLHDLGGIINQCQNCRQQFPVTELWSKDAEWTLTRTQRGQSKMERTQYHHKDVPPDATGIHKFQLFPVEGGVCQHFLQIGAAGFNTPEPMRQGDDASTPASSIRHVVPDATGIPRKGGVCQHVPQIGAAESKTPELMSQGDDASTAASSDIVNINTQTLSTTTSYSFTTRRLSVTAI